MKTNRCLHQIVVFAAIVTAVGAAAFGAASDAARMSSDMMNPGTPLRIKEHCCGGSFKVLFYGNSIAMYDITGRKVLEEAFTEELSIRHLPNGLYLMNIITAEGKVISKKIMVNR